MARIRSVHPGLFTDEHFVACAPLARLLIIGLWTEADDQGVFEWKPVTIKMRLLPVDNADIPALLTELVDNNIVKYFEVSGKQYGAIRNFRKYQRPKSPNAIHPLPPDFRSYVCLPSAVSEIDGDDPPPIPPKEENAPQREEGGGRVEKEEGKEVEARAPAKRGTRLPPEWTPSRENIEFCLKEGLTHDDAANIGRRFKNHWLAKPGKDAVKLDWDRTWDNWVLRDIEDGRVGSRGPGPQRRGAVSDVELAADWAARNSP